MLKLGVNIDHVATVRQARYRGREHGEPDPVEAARLCCIAGCHGITAHLREDRRHILDRDIWRLKEILTIPLNFEMANTPEMLDMALRLQPHSVCLVPERRREVTTEGGLDAAGQLASLEESTAKMSDAGIEVSFFVTPDPKQIEASAKAGSHMIELHTGAFAEAFDDETLRGQEIERLIAASELGHSLGLKINAGHGINYHNLPTLYEVRHLRELNIGHSIVSRAVMVGIEAAVKQMLLLMEAYSA